MTFPIKKRISTELFINRKQALYTYKRDKERIMRNILIKINVSRIITDLFKEGRTETAGKENVGMKTRQPVWNDLHFTEGKAN